ncbi:MAG: NADH-quinone oxidoreductase subunit G, partial [Gammaproteobacteria bacterium]|nr:NADH-quinone oxidoreductase subunit G [Gammaproteobacteria bacterium]
DIPRFCYHKKLSVAANCRMCLVEVEKAPKPLPACATPVMPDMVVHTKSRLARNAQKGTMEFLMINHPLDCPICDQGGECELQDVALGYGESSSQYTEGKRVVMDKYIGPLIATEMTRCIHCTRCVRFGEEIAGVRELGATGRGEHVRIGTYIEKSVVSEVSGNVIDICPVGALTARPSRFTARAWELSQHPSVSPHDCVGANIFVHLDKTEVNRVVPRENEAVNEVWLADRDRFAYQGLNSPERLETPMIRIDGKLQETDWETALNKAADDLAAAGSELAALVSPYATIEEQFLAQKIVRALGSNNIDHRVGQIDFTDQATAPVMPWLGMDFAALENVGSALLVGSNIRKEQPIAALRLRKAALKGADISLLNGSRAPLHFEALENIAAGPADFLLELGAIAKAAGASLSEISSVPDLTVSDSHRKIAESLSKADDSIVLLGSQAVASPDFSLIRAMSALLAETTGARLVYLPEAGNTCGAWLSGCVPHRLAGGSATGQSGRNAAEILSGKNKTLLLLGVEPELDAADPTQAVKALQNADRRVFIGSYLSKEVEASADVVLPQAVFTESAGTYVNASGRWQSARGVTVP